MLIQQLTQLFVISYEKAPTKGKRKDSAKLLKVVESAHCLELWKSYHDSHFVIIHNGWPMVML